MVIVRRTLWGRTRRDIDFVYLVDTCAGGIWSQDVDEAVEFADLTEVRDAMRAAEIVLTLADEIVEAPRS